MRAGPRQQGLRLSGGQDGTYKKHHHITIYVNQNGMLEKKIEKTRKNFHTKNPSG